MSNVKSRTTIQGTIPKFVQAELEVRQNGFQSMYEQTSQCMELVHENIPYAFLNSIVEKVKLGYVISQKQPITTLPLDYSAYLIKPPEQQALDLQLINERVKLEYIAELEIKRAEFKELVKQQLLEKAELDEQKKIDDKRNKLLAEVEKEVNDAFGDLVLPA